MARIIYGSELSVKLKSDMAHRVQQYTQTHRQPKLAVVLVGDDPASMSYVKGKEKACDAIGMASKTYHLDGSTTLDTLLTLIDGLNHDHTVDGILVQLPLPDHLDEQQVLSKIDPSKDVDGLTPISMGHFFANQPGFKPCTPLGIMALLKEANVTIEGKHAVVVGRSQLVGNPIAQLLLRANATVTMCHSRTVDLEEVTQTADILIVAIGKPRYIGANHVKDGAVVIDVGVNRVDGKLCGDVDFDMVEPKASVITPVPKGVGPMTITMLLSNTLQAYRLHEGIDV